MEIAICPSCRKEISEDSKSCDHCASPVVSVIHKTIFSWQWSDKIFLFAVLLVFIAFFQPWFPGSILYQDAPVSAYQMLLNVSDLEVDFLQSYNILRMALIVPIFALLIYFLTYFRRSMQKSVFLPLFLFIIVSVAIIPFLFETAGTALWNHPHSNASPWNILLFSQCLSPGSSWLYKLLVFSFFSCAFPYLFINWISPGYFILSLRILIFQKHTASG